MLHHSQFRTAKVCALHAQPIFDIATRRNKISTMHGERARPRARESPMRASGNHYSGALFCGFIILIEHKFSDKVHILYSIDGCACTLHSSKSSRHAAAWLALPIVRFKTRGSVDPLLLSTCCAAAAAPFSRLPSALPRKTRV